jgi:hypothetical protein
VPGGEVVGFVGVGRVVRAFGTVGRSGVVGHRRDCGRGAKKRVGGVARRGRPGATVLPRGRHARV